MSAVPTSLLLLLLSGCSSHGTDPQRDTGGIDTATGSGSIPVFRFANDREYLPTALAMLQEARERVRVIQYVIYEGDGVDDILQLLAAAAARGVDVRLLADEEGPQTAGVLDSLQRMGVQASLDSPSRTTHNKLLLVDDQLLVGSTNWSQSALTSNHEADVYALSPELSAFFAEYFDALWADSLHPPDELVWTGGGPAIPLHEDQVVQAALDCMEGARERVELVMYAATYSSAWPDGDPERLLDALADARDRGLAVRVVLDGSDWIVENGVDEAAIAYLQARGVELRRTPPEVTTHAKLLLCDEQVLVSDANWTYSALDTYNGTSLLVEDAELAEQYADWVDELWNEASEP